MPNYTYKCTCCSNRFDRFLPLSKYKEPQTCPECQGDTKRIIVNGHGGTHGDEAPWIQSTNVALTHKNLNHKWGKPITNRTELKQRMKEKGVHHTD